MSEMQSKDLSLTAIQRNLNPRDPRFAAVIIDLSHCSIKVCVCVCALAIMFMFSTALLYLLTRVPVGLFLWVVTKKLAVFFLGCHNGACRST